MCAGALLQARVGTLVYGARNTLSGAMNLCYSRPSAMQRKSGLFPKDGSKETGRCGLADGPEHGRSCAAAGADGSWVNLLPPSRPARAGMQQRRPHPFHPNMQARGCRLLSAPSPGYSWCSRCSVQPAWVVGFAVSLCSIGVLHCLNARVHGGCLSTVAATAGEEGRLQRAVQRGAEDFLPVAAHATWFPGGRGPDPPQRTGRSQCQVMTWRLRTAAPVVR